MTTTSEAPRSAPDPDEKLRAVFSEYLAKLGAPRALTAGETTEALSILRGRTCKDAADERGVSGETVRATRKRIYRKLGVESASALSAAVLRLALSR